jgi:very-short-patch-repair endonuclease
MVLTMDGGTTSFGIDLAIRRIASGQFGLVTRQQLEAVGVRRSAIARRRSVGLLVPVLPSVMRLGDVPVSPVQMSLAGGLAVPGGVVTGPSAAVVDGLPVSAPCEPIVVVGEARSAKCSGVEIIRSAEPWPSRWWSGVRVTTTTATIVSLPRFVSSAVLEECLDHAITHRLTTAARVRALVERLPHQAVPGRADLIDLLDQRTEGRGHRSKVERKIGRWLRSAGMGGWIANYDVPVVGGTIECDLAWVAHQVDLEISPFHTHGSERTQARDAERRRTLTEAGWRVIEATDEHLVSRKAFDPIITSLRRLGVDGSLFAA